MSHTRLIASASIDIAAPAECIYPVWADVARWALWDPDTRQASLDGPLALGARGRLVPRRGRAVPMRVTGLEPGRRLDVMCPVLGSSLHFAHELQPLARGGCRVTHRAESRGWLAPVLAAIVGPDLRRGLPATMESLKRYVEAMPAPDARGA